MELLLLRELFRSFEEFMQSASVGVEGRLGLDLLMGGRVFELSSSTDLEITSLSSCCRLRGLENADAEPVAMVAICGCSRLGNLLSSELGVVVMSCSCNQLLQFVMNKYVKLAFNSFQVIAKTINRDENSKDVVLSSLNKAQWMSLVTRSETRSSTRRLNFHLAANPQTP